MQAYETIRMKHILKKIAPISIGYNVHDPNIN